MSFFACITKIVQSQTAIGINCRTRLFDSRRIVCSRNSATRLTPKCQADVKSWQMICQTTTIPAPLALSASVQSPVSISGFSVSAFLFNPSTPRRPEIR
jgi:hypothetical protein